MSVLVLPSWNTRSWKEQFGHVLIEAMACGVPVVGTDSGAIPEVIGDAGVVVKQRNADELASALSRLKNEPNLSSTLRRMGQERIRRSYTDAAVASKLASFLRELQ